MEQLSFILQIRIPTCAVIYGAAACGMRLDDTIRIMCAQLRLFWTMADLNSEEMDPAIEARVKPANSAFERVRLCIWREEIRKRILSQFLHMNAVANQQSVD
jgi:hypothetical protein